MLTGKTQAPRCPLSSPTHPASSPCSSADRELSIPLLSRVLSFQVDTTMLAFLIRLFHKITGKINSSKQNKEMCNSDTNFHSNISIKVFVKHVSILYFFISILKCKTFVYFFGIYQYTIKNLSKTSLITTTFKFWTYCITTFLILDTMCYFLYLFCSSSYIFQICLFKIMICNQVIYYYSMST